MNEVKNSIGLHTRGPWAWVVDKDELSDTCPKLVGADGVNICDFGDSTTYYPSCGNEPNDADMALIAAAPDLLDVAKGLVDLGIDERFIAESWPELAKVLAGAKLATSKARGES